MRGFTLVSLITLSLVCCKTNSKPNPDLEYEDIKGESDEEICVLSKLDKKFDLTFPFNSSDSVVIISYSDYNHTVKDIEKSILVKGRLDYDSIIQSIHLGSKQVEELFNLLYSYELEGIREVGMCYNPRHSIVFYNRNEPIEVLEICFECFRYTTAFKTDFGDFCQLKFSGLENYFKSTGITYGLDKNIFD